MKKQLTESEKKAWRKIALGYAAGAEPGQLDGVIRCAGWIIRAGIVTRREMEAAFRAAR